MAALALHVRGKLPNELSLVLLHGLHSIDVKHLVRIHCHQNATRIGLWMCGINSPFVHNDQCIDAAQHKF